MLTLKADAGEGVVVAQRRRLDPAERRDAVAIPVPVVLRRQPFALKMWKVSMYTWLRPAVVELADRGVLPGVVVRRDPSRTSAPRDTRGRCSHQRRSSTSLR